jgi:hypothetical protein
MLRTTGPSGRPRRRPRAPAASCWAAAGRRLTRQTLQTPATGSLLAQAAAAAAAEAAPAVSERAATQAVPSGTAARLPEGAMTAGANMSCTVHT